MNQLNYNILSAILVMLISMAGYAQNPVGGGQGPPPPQGGTPPPGLPIDDGLIVLFAVGLVYGIYILVKKRLNSQSHV